VRSAGEVSVRLRVEGQLSESLGDKLQHQHQPMARALLLLISLQLLLSMRATGTARQEAAWLLARRWDCSLVDKQPAQVVE
jgi:hypothetical protein